MIAITYAYLREANDPNLYLTQWVEEGVALQTIRELCQDGFIIIRISHPTGGTK